MRSLIEFWLRSSQARKLNPFSKSGWHSRKGTVTMLELRLSSRRLYAYYSRHMDISDVAFGRSRMWSKCTNDGLASFFTVSDALVSSAEVLFRFEADQALSMVTSVISTCIVSGQRYGSFRNRRIATAVRQAGARVPNSMWRLMGAGGDSQFFDNLRRLSASSFSLRNLGCVTYSKSQR